MSSDNTQGGSVSIKDVSCGEVDAESNNIDSLEVVSSGEDTMHELESAAELLTLVELDIARSSEKLINLYILVTHVASRGNDLEAFAMKGEHTLERLEFDLLHKFLDSEVSELEGFISALHTELAISREAVFLFKHLGDTFYDIEDKLRDCEDSLRQSFKQISDIKVQSANSQRILLASSGDEKWKVGEEVGCLENNNSPDLSTEIKVQTAEQKRSVWRMLEKSLARELGLEKKLTESRETEEELKFRLQEEAFSMEQEAENMCERLFEAENSAEILFGVSKELFAQIQKVQFRSNGLIQREGELKSKLEDFSEQKKELVQKASEAEKRAKIAEAVCKKLRESNMELNADVSRLKSSISDVTNQVEKRAEIVEAECKTLRESNLELNADVSRLKSGISNATNQVEQLERQLKDSEIKRLHAVASAEASQEKQSMLDCTIKDMENLIKDLKSKVQRANSQTESAEDKCIILSESNAELIEERDFLRHRMEHFESSLRRADEAKKETAKNIRVQAKLITDLVLQLALERERLHKQISSLTKEKKVAVKFSQQIKDPAVNVIGSLDAKVEEVKLSKIDSQNGSPGKESNEEISGSSATSVEIGNTQKDWSESGTNKGPDDDVDPVRNIDARQLKSSYTLLLIVITLAITVLASFTFSAASY